MALEAMRRQAIDANYPVDTGDNTQILADASVTARVSALALIHAASKPSGIIFPVKYDDASFAPTAETARKLFLAAFHEGLLIVHPSTPTKGFVWDEASPEVLSDSIYTQFVRFVPPGDGPLDCRLEDFAENLRTSLEIEYMDFDERLELTELLQQLIAGESMRSLSYELGLHGLPSPSDSHLESHRSHALKAAGLFSLGHIYKFAWTAARDASSAYQRIGGMSRANATTHGLNKFATYIQRGIDEPSFLGSPYNERNDLQLSAATDIGFRIVLQANPMTSTPTSLTEDLLISPGSGLPPLCVSTVPDRSAIIEWLRTSDSWTPIDFREALAKLSDETSACLPGCVHERSHVTARFAGELYDRIVSRCGAYDSAIVTAEALRLSNFGADHGLTGDLVLAELAVNLGWEARAVDDLP
ncbi:hypothetical protein [Mycetocola sp. JXN-3]|uniref:hypothetical protein n=1 Tax=Mycetocola sp. JXN-3 TaxID=2116510 RepID=UPI00165D0169|nr:hypothetical protein [Mycetocola sp. JXN-3]